MPIRLAGLASCLVAATAGVLLFRSGGAASPAGPTLWKIALALTAFLLASVGAALLWAGRALFEPLPPPVGRCRCAACDAARDRAERQARRPIGARAPGARTGSSGYP